MTGYSTCQCVPNVQGHRKYMLVSYIVHTFIDLNFSTCVWVCVGGYIEGLKMELLAAMLKPIGHSTSICNQVVQGFYYWYDWSPSDHKWTCMWCIYMLCISWLTCVLHRPLYSQATSLAIPWHPCNNLHHLMTISHNEHYNIHRIDESKSILHWWLHLINNNSN